MRYVRKRSNDGCDGLGVGPRSRLARPDDPGIRLDLDHAVRAALEATARGDEHDANVLDQHHPSSGPGTSPTLHGNVAERQSGSSAVVAGAFDAGEEEVAMTIASGRVALITGGAAGLGSAVARLLASSGVRLVLVDVAADRLELARAAVGRAAATIVGDVRSADDMARAVDEAVIASGRWTRSSSRRA